MMFRLELYSIAADLPKIYFVIMITQGFILGSSPNVGKAYYI
jgi:hypothetical protein